ncbi:Pterin-4-alpha-carbinolamine dehydratase 2, mitochondrial [Dionaea muscipula]
MRRMIPFPLRHLAPFSSQVRFTPQPLTSIFLQSHGRWLLACGSQVKLPYPNAQISSHIWETEIFQNPFEVPKCRKKLHGFRTFCTATDLVAKKCVPCNSKDMRPMNEALANDLITKVPGWNLLNEGGILKLTRSWRVKSFTKGLELFQVVANVAEAEGHHPDLHLVGWNNVTIEIWTHAVGGVTENDFILAAKISELDLAHLLRRKAAA